MLTVTIEPGVFAPPSGKPTAESVRSYVLTLLHWKAILDEGSATILTCTSTSDVLIRCACYPFRTELRTLLNDTAVSEYDFNTVAVLVPTLLKRSGRLEDVTGIRDVLVANDLRIVPNVFANHAPEELKSEGEKCAVVVAIIRTASKDPSACAHALALRAGHSSLQVAVDAQIDIIDHSRPDLGHLPMAPDRFQGAAIICQTFADFLRAVDELTLWKAACANSDLENAIRVAIYRSRITRNVPVTWTSIPHFRINQRFYETAAACGALTTDSLARSVLRSIVETVEDLQMASVHPLRDGAGPDDDQKKRGRDMAWRRDITYEHHLHYWQCTDELKELSCIVAHNCFDIIP